MPPLYVLVNSEQERYYPLPKKIDPEEVRRKIEREKERARIKRMVKKQDQKCDPEMEKEEKV